MEYEKYSKENFDRVSATRFVRELSDQLQEDVLIELHPIIERAVAEIVARLNEQGHGLEMFENYGPGEYTYRDQVENNSCKLRLACDVIISAGFADAGPTSSRK